MKQQIKNISEISVSDLNTDTLTETSLIRLMTENNTKIIKYLGYGYYGGDPDEKPYRFVEYCFFEVPLKDVLPDIVDYENQNGSEYKQYIEECDEKELFEFYTEYDNGNAPTLIQSKDINENTPDGCYIILDDFDIAAYNIQNTE